MSPPGMAAAAADDGRFCLPWAAPGAAQFENWGDSGIVVTSPLTEATSTDVSGDRQQAAQMVCLPLCSWLFSILYTASRPPCNVVYL